MNLVLKRFSQDVDLINGGQKLNFLVFDHDGEEVRFPVPEETMLALMAWMSKHVHQTGGTPPSRPLYVEEIDTQNTPVEEDDSFEGEATQFGGEQDDEDFEEGDAPEDQIPGSEDEVPPL